MSNRRFAMHRLSMPRTANIDEILKRRQSRRSPLGRLMARAEERTAWTNQLRALLPAEEAGHYAVAGIRDGRMTILAQSASWATRLRFRAPELLPALNALRDFTDVREIHVLPAGKPW